jgi:hypothetical protein
MTKEESDRRARITGLSTIKYWIENDIEVGDLDEMPKPHYRPTIYIKTALLWAFYYLRSNFNYEKAVKDIISKGGDTRSNAAIVGGMIGATNGINGQKVQFVEAKE